MAGKKQHFIPQHFQKPFVIPGSHDRLWMFRRGKSSGFTVARKKAAAKEYFYSKPSPDGLPTLDDLVTEYENDLHKIVDRIRELEIESAVDSREIAQVDCSSCSPFFSLTRNHGRGRRSGGPMLRKDCFASNLETL